MVCPQTSGSSNKAAEAGRKLDAMCPDVPRKRGAKSVRSFTTLREVNVHSAAASTSNVIGRLGTDRTFLQKKGTEPEFDSQGFGWIKRETGGYVAEETPNTGVQLKNKGWSRRRAKQQHAAQ